MSQLSADQRLFLKRHGIPLSQVFDASGLTTYQRLTAMDALELNFYYGGALCREAGHELRSKAGHCIECNTARIAFQLRNSQSGYIYLAYSHRSKCAKVGVTSVGPKERVAYLAFSGYGNCSDWQLIVNVYAPNKAGMKEFLIHSLLEKYQKPAVYSKQSDIDVECREVFFCEIETAKSAFNSVLKPS